MLGVLQLTITMIGIKITDTPVIKKDRAQILNEIKKLISVDLLNLRIKYLCLIIIALVVTLNLNAVDETTPPGKNMLSVDQTHSKDNSDFSDFIMPLLLSTSIMATFDITKKLLPAENGLMKNYIKAASIVTTISSIAAFPTIPSLVSALTCLTICHSITRISVKEVVANLTNELIELIKIESSKSVSEKNQLNRYFYQVLTDLAFIDEASNENSVVKQAARTISKAINNANIPHQSLG